MIGVSHMSDYRTSQLESKSKSPRILVWPRSKQKKTRALTLLRSMLVCLVCTYCTGWMCSSNRYSVRRSNDSFQGWMRPSFLVATDYTCQRKTTWHSPHPKHLWVACYRKIRSRNNHLKDHVINPTCGVMIHAICGSRSHVDIILLTKLMIRMSTFPSPGYAAPVPICFCSLVVRHDPLQVITPRAIQKWQYMHMNDVHV